MNYNQEILHVLVMAGHDGLKMEKIVRHVFNACNSMFHPLNYKDVYNYVSQYLKKSLKSPHPFIEKVGYGVYRINESASDAKQYILQFKEQEVGEIQVQEEGEDLSLSLFDMEGF